MRNVLNAVSLAVFAGCGLATPVAAQDTVWALTNARIETVTRGVIDKGTIIIRGGRIAAVGARVTVPPDARVLDLSNLTVSPGLIDLTASFGVESMDPSPAGGRGGRGAAPSSPVAASSPYFGLDPERRIASEVRVSPRDARAARATGVAAALIAPRVGTFRGVSALIAMRDDASGDDAIRPAVAQHLGFQAPGRQPGPAIPAPTGVLGVIAFQRQALHDAQWRARYGDRARFAEPRPSSAMPDAKVEALLPVVRRAMPVFFDATTEREIRIATRIAREFDLPFTISGATEAYRALDAIDGNPLIVSVNVPRAEGATGWSYRLTLRHAPDDDTAARSARQVLEANAATLHRAGVRFALASGGAPYDAFIPNVRRVIAAGLPADVALAALTIRAAEIAGAADSLGSVEAGKVANLVISSGGNALASSSIIKDVFVRGVRYSADSARQGRPAPGATTPVAPIASSWGGARPLFMPVPGPARLVAITNATILTASHGTIQNGTIVIRDGKIAEVGPAVRVPSGASVIDARGRFVTPGLIDSHSHTGTQNSAESGDIVNAETNVLDAVWHDELAMYRLLAGGVTSGLTLYGSGSPIGGQSYVLKFKWGFPLDSMRETRAMPGIKFALGENVRTTSPNPNAPASRPRSRMGVEQVIRERFLSARAYQNEWAAYRHGLASRGPGDAEPVPPRRDLELDVLVEIMEGKRLVHTHAYRADEMLALMQIARDFGFRIGTFQHVLEGYKIADELAAAGTGAATFVDFLNYKQEAWDGIVFNAALMNERGVLVTVNSDSDERARRLYQEAAKTIRYGGVSEEDALRMVTLNAARQLGMDRYTGSIDVGKDADLAIFSAHPFSPAAHVDMTLIEGRVFFDRATAPSLDALRSSMRSEGR